MTKKLIAEALGTMILVLFGCGAAVIAGPEIGFTGHFAGLRAVDRGGGLRPWRDLGRASEPGGVAGHGDWRADERR